MPIPKPKKGEDRKSFIGRCMGDTIMMKEYPQQKQRAGVCGTAWSRKGKSNYTYNSLITNFTSIMRTVEKDGRGYFIVPITALVEGVHHGSGGKAFYPAVEIDRTAQNWNGIPLTVDHPKRNDIPVTANDPDTLKKYGVGTFENVRYEGGKLKGEGWIDINRVAMLFPEVLEIVKAGDKLEVSTGLYSETDGLEGQWMGEEFVETLSDFVPDHLALLPEGVGACNWDDGCGVRMNKKEEAEKKANEILKEYVTLVQEGGGSVYEKEINALKAAGFWVNEISHSKIREQLYKLVSDMDKPGTMHFLREVFDNKFIFEKNTGNEAKLFSLGYSMNKEDEIKVKGDPSEVKEKVEFISVNKGGNDMERKKAVQALIANEVLPFTEKDAEWLSEVDDERFDNLFTLNDCECKEREENLLKANSKVEELEKTVGELEEKLKPNGDGEEKEVTFDALLANAKPEDREAWNTMLAEKKAKKDEAVKAILANENNKFAEDQLDKMSIDTLVNILSIAKEADVEVNYSGNGSRKQTSFKRNERHEDGSGVPDMPKARWNKDGTPDFSHLGQ